MKSIKMAALVLGTIFFVVGAMATAAHSESPLIITPFQWFTGDMDFGSSKHSTFTVQNTGNSPVVIRGILLRTGSSCFSVTPLTPLPATLPAAGEMEFEITFSADAEGLQRASIEVDYEEVSP